MPTSRLSATWPRGAVERPTCQLCSRRTLAIGTLGLQHEARGCSAAALLKAFNSAHGAQAPASHCCLDLQSLSSML
jgi:hypothetical protein